MKMIDCNLWVGKRSRPTIHDLASTEQTVKMLRKFQINGALATHFAAVEHHPFTGNTFLLEEIAGFRDKLFPVWTVLPSATGEFSGGDTLKKQLKQHRICMARIYPHPQNHNFQIAEWCAQELLDTIAACGLPLMIDAGQVTWNELETVLRSHPTLSIILSSMTYRYDRYTYPLMKKYKNLYLETSGVKGFLSIEDICKTFGAERLLFGSNLPVYDMGSAFAILNFAAISQREKELIASGNILKLTGATLQG